MKLKFYFLIFLLLFARGCDFYSTSLWIFDNPGDETNPLSRFFGLGWTGLIVTNILLVGGIIYLFYYYSFKYTPGAVSVRPEKMTDYISELYFKEKGKFYQVFYKFPFRNKAAWAHTGYIFVRVVIVGSFLAVFHNLCQYYNADFYNTYRQAAGRPLFVLYGLFMLSIAYFAFRIWQREFKTAQKHFDLHAAP